MSKQLKLTCQQCDKTFLIFPYRKNTANFCSHKCASKGKITHRMTGTKIYKRWGGMLRRCQNSNAPNYHLYGGRGIKVCKRWQKFENFYKDMGNFPDNCTLDRIDTDGNYEPSNCRWATPEQQSNNMRNNHNLTFKGKTMSLTQWARKIGMNYQTLQMRLDFYKWPLERALLTPVKKYNHE